MNRDKLRRISIPAAIVFILALIVITTARLARREEKSVIFAMDTSITLTAYGIHAKEALIAAEERLLELERLWSVTDSESEVYEINHSGGSTVTVSGETSGLLEFALDMADKTNGAFEPTIYPVLKAWGFTTGNYRIPSDDELSMLLQYVGYEKVISDGTSVTVPSGTQLDFGAVAKGYAADITAEIMKAQGVSSALIDMGGNILTIGSKPDGTAWRIAIKDPGGNGNIGIAENRSMSVVTSGGYERYFTDPDGQIYRHIIDPANGKPAQSGLSSVTVIATQSRLCDALSTALFVMGQSGAESFWKENPGFEMVLITEDGKVYITEGLENNFTLTERHKDKQLSVVRR